MCFKLICNSLLHIIGLHLRFRGVRAATLQNTDLLNVTPCYLVLIYQTFEGTYFRWHGNTIYNYYDYFIFISTGCLYPVCHFICQILRDLLAIVTLQFTLHSAIRELQFSMLCIHIKILTDFEVNTLLFFTLLILSLPS